MTSFDPRTARTWAEIDLNRLEANVRTLRHRYATADGDDVVAVVKADAYGHGAARVASVCQAAGLSHFGVATLEEARELRQAGIRSDIYVLSPLLPQEMVTAVRTDVIPMLSSSEQLTALIAAGKMAPLPARTVLKVDTGMGRSGAVPDQALALWRTAAGATNAVRIVGIATHFSSADEMDDAGQAATTAQAQAFARFLAEIQEEIGFAAGPPDDGRGGQGLWLSLENSPAALLPHLHAIGAQFPYRRGRLVRAGLLLYGIEPYRGAEGNDFLPLLRWRARVTLVKELPAGATVGYGRTHTLTRASRIATLAVGYADGLSRRLSSKGEVLIGGRRYPILGRVSMDQCQIDVTDTPVPVTAGDVATLLGSDGSEEQTILDLAERIGTTPHAVPCALTHRVPRLYVRPDLFLAES